MRSFNDEVTPREWATWNHDKEIFELQMAHSKEMKQLEVESNRISSKWTTIFRLPLAIIKLPVQILIVLPLIVYAIRGIDPPESLSTFIKM